MTASSLIAHCFGSASDLPPWLMQPGLTLQGAAHRERPLAARLHDLAQVLDEVDDLFAVHLPAQRQWFQTWATTGTPAETVARWVDTLFSEAGLLLRRQLLPDLAATGIAIQPVAKLDEGQRARLQEYFARHIYPLLTPLAVDPGRPFPYISSESLNLLVELRKPEVRRPGAPNLLARVKIPTSAPRLILAPARPAGVPAVGDSTAADAYVCTADVVRYFVRHLFPDVPVRRVYMFRVVRGETPLPGTLETGALRPRREENRPAVRLDVERRMDPKVLAWLVERLRLPAYAVARHDGLAEWACLPNLASADLPRRQ